MAGTSKGKWEPFSSASVVGSIAAFRFRKLSFELKAHPPTSELLSPASEKEEKSHGLPSGSKNQHFLSVDFFLTIEYIENTFHSQRNLLKVDRGETFGHAGAV
jgi:hypothetical protein